MAVTNKQRTWIPNKMAQLQAVRGTQDLLPVEARRHRIVTETARTIAERYGFDEIVTPIFEFTEVFSRPIGEATDVVSKEMYNFTDRSGDQLSLRPENTAGVGARCHVQRFDAIDAAQILLCGADVPPRTPTKRPLPPILPDRRRASRP